MTVPLTYTVHWSDDEEIWKVWKNGALTRKPSRVFQRKRPAVEHAMSQARRYSADGVIVQKRDHTIHTVKQTEKSNTDPYKNAEATIRVRWNEPDTSFGWMITCEWGRGGLFAWNYGRRDDAESNARMLRNAINAYRVVVHNRQGPQSSGGSSTMYNPAISRSDLPR